MLGEVSRDCREVSRCLASALGLRGAGAGSGEGGVECAEGVDEGGDRSRRAWGGRAGAGEGREARAPEARTRRAPPPRARAPVRGPPRGLRRCSGVARPRGPGVCLDAGRGVRGIPHPCPGPAGLHVVAGYLHVARLWREVGGSSVPEMLLLNGAFEPSSPSPSK